MAGTNKESELSSLFSRGRADGSSTRLMRPSNCFMKYVLVSGATRQKGISRKCPHQEKRMKTSVDSDMYSRPVLRYANGHGLCECTSALDILWCSETETVELVIKLNYRQTDRQTGYSLLAVRCTYCSFLLDTSISLDIIPVTVLLI